MKYAGFWWSMQPWLDTQDIAEEMEPRERRIIETPTRQLAQQDVIDSIWTLEGLVVLAWAPEFGPLVSLKLDSEA